MQGRLCHRTEPVFSSQWKITLLNLETGRCSFFSSAFGSGSVAVGTKRWFQKRNRLRSVGVNPLGRKDRSTHLFARDRDRPRYLQLWPALWPSPDRPAVSHIPSVRLGPVPPTDKTGGKGQRPPHANETNTTEIRCRMTLSRRGEIYTRDRMQGTT